MLITKMAECSVRLMRIQNRENAMFDLASSEAGHPEESIKSLDNSSEKLIQAVRDAYSENWHLDPSTFVKKMTIIDEIDRQNLSDVSGWIYVEDNMPITTNYIIKNALTKILTCLTLSLEKPINQKISALGLSLKENIALMKTCHYPSKKS